MKPAEHILSFSVNEPESSAIQYIETCVLSERHGCNMHFILDIVIVALCVLTILVSYKRGFFKSVMSLCSGVGALLVAYTFTPKLAIIVKEKFLLDKIAGGVVDTLASMAKAGADGAQNMVYDLSKLLENSQFLKILDQYGADSQHITELINSANDGSHAAVEQVSYAVADPIAGTIANIAVFIGLFLAAILVLRLITWAIGIVFTLPVLRGVDKMLGLVFGVISALLFVWIFAMVADAAVQAIASVAPGTIDASILDDSVLLKFFARYNPIEAITNAVFGH